VPCNAPVEKEGCDLRSSNLLAIVTTVAAAVGLLISPAVAGPPCVTDDPQRVPYQHFASTLSLGTAIRGDTSGLGPAWEYNYRGVTLARRLKTIGGRRMQGPGYFEI
jgi:hypothetical protein